jgi:nitronate monooxygenase
MQTKFSQLLGIKHPIMQAPIGSATTAELAAAVSNAGGLGTLALSWKSLEDTKAFIQQTKQQTDKPFAVNLVLAFEQAERVKICIEEQVPVVSFFWGDSTPFLDALKQNNTLVCQTVCNASEAMAYERKGVDFLIAQGWEAGGHVLGTVASSVLIPSIADKVSIPIVAAGGIADGRGILSALNLGAAGACLGTRFLMSKEANVDAMYQQLVAKATENDTLYAKRLFNIGWDHAPHRVIQNSTTKNWENAGSPLVGERPNEHEVVAHKTNGQPILRYSDDGPLLGTTGNLEALALYAGQSAGLINEVKSAADIVADLMLEMEASFAKLQKMMIEK